MLLGDNGAGKSTLLQCVAGLHPAAAGTVRIGDRAVDETRTHFRRMVAALLDEGTWYPSLTVREHVELIQMVNMPAAHPWVEPAELIDSLGLAEVRAWLRLRRVRSARARRSLDGVYTVVLFAVFVMVTAVMAVRSLAEKTNPAQGSATGLIVAAALGCASTALLAASAFGPLSASPATLMWLATSPISRRGLLLVRFTAVVSTSALAGIAAVGVLVPGALFSSHAPYVILLGSAAAGTMAAVAILVQTVARDPARLLRRASAGTGLAAVTAAGAVVTGRWSGGHVTGASLDGRWVIPALLVGLSASDTVVIIGWLAAGLLAIGQVTGNVRCDRDRPALARLMGLTDRRLLALRSVIPAVLAVCWGALSVALVAQRAGADVAVAVGLGAAAGPALAAPVEDPFRAWSSGRKSRAGRVRRLCLAAVGGRRKGRGFPCSREEAP